MYLDHVFPKKTSRVIATIFALLAVGPVAVLLGIAAMNISFGFPWWEGLNQAGVLVSTTIGLVGSIICLDSTRELLRHQQFAASVRFLPWVQGAYFVLVLLLKLPSSA